MENEIDKIEEIKDFTEEELNDESVDWKAKAQESLGIAKRRTTQWQKEKEELARLKTENESLKPKEQKPQDKIDNKTQLDYAQLAFLKACGIDHKEDVQFFLDHAKRTGTELAEAVNDEWALAKWKKTKETREAVDGTPSSSGRSPSIPSKKTAAYWIEKGGLPEDDVELRRQVVNERMRIDALKTTLPSQK